MSNVKSSVNEDLITLTVIPYINGEPDKIAYQYDKTSDTTVDEIVANLALQYQVDQYSIQMRIPDAEDTPMYLVQNSCKISNIGDSSTLCACITK